MQKKYLIIGIVVLLLVSGGVYYASKPKNNVNIENKNVFTSVKDALSKKLTLVCEFKDESGVSTKSYIKNGAVRVSSSGEFILKDKKMYMWDVNTKQGFVYDVPDEDGGNDVGSSVDEINQSESYLNMIDKYKDSCKVANVEDSYFTPPLDIKFQEMSKLLENINGSNFRN